MDKKCITCQKKNYYLLCISCSKNPFKVEEARGILAKKDTKTFKSLYSKKFAEIKDLNSKPFWDEKLSDDQYLASTDGMTQDRVEATYKFIPNNSKRVFDIGLGHGFIEEIINKKNPSIELYGNDISVAAINNIQKRFKGLFTVESIYNMHQKKNFFDVVFTLEVLEHVPPSKIFSVLKSIKEIIKPNGFFIFSLPMNEGLEHMTTNPSGHVRTYTKDVIFKELEISGFKIVEFKEFYAFPKFYKLKKLISKILKQRWKPNNVVVLAKSV